MEIGVPRHYPLSKSHSPNESSVGSPLDEEWEDKEDEENIDLANEVHS
jgi:hypothetical protein